MKYPGASLCQAPWKQVLVLLGLQEKSDKDKECLDSKNLGYFIADIWLDSCPKDRPHLVVFGYKLLYVVLFYGDLFCVDEYKNFWALIVYMCSATLVQYF